MFFLHKEPVFPWLKFPSKGTSLSGDIKVCTLICQSCIFPGWPTSRWGNTIIFKDESFVFRFYTFKVTNFRCAWGDMVHTFSLSLLNHMSEAHFLFFYYVLVLLLCSYCYSGCLLHYNRAWVCMCGATIVDVFLTLTRQIPQQTHSSQTPAALSLCSAPPVVSATVSLSTQ